MSRPLLAARALGAAVVAVRLARGARRRPPLRPLPADPTAGGVSVVIPARDEERRIGPVLAAVVDDPQVTEVIVVDDESTDATAGVAAAAGARVVPGRPLPAGWVGKPWALQQGLEAANCEWVVGLDADVAPVPGFVGALVRAATERGTDLLTCGGRFVCDTPGQRLLHPAMLATLVVRFGPPDAGRPPPARITANGQCTIARREVLLGAGGYGPIRDHLTDDVALARHLAHQGWRVAFADGTRLFDVRMHASAREVWRDWGRSLPMPDVTSRPWQAADLATIWLTLALPLPRLLARRGDRLDVALLVGRIAMLAATAPAYRRRGLPYWLSPLADLPVAVRLTWGAIRPGRSWRGRRYERTPRRRGRGS